jgi:Domain of unknown function (DUF4157)
MRSLQQLSTITAHQPASAALLQRACACGNRTIAGGECEACRKKGLQHAAMNSQSVGEAPPIVHDVLRSPGQRLDATTRAFMEPRFGQDFSGVRVHTDAQAAESARSVNALAYTVGRDVVFGAGQYAPQTNVGQRLMAHELTHVMQQSNHSSLQTKLTIGSVKDSFEQQADNVAKIVDQNLSSYVQETTAMHGAAKQGQSSLKIGNQCPSVIVQRQSIPSVRRPPFDDEPAQLRDVLEASYVAGKFGCKEGIDVVSCYNRLDASARFVLKSLYSRLTQFGLWDHILYAWGMWITGVGGAHFMVKDHVKFLDALIASARFCIDSAAGGMLHKGTTSVREISSGDSLHLSIGSGNHITAHIDAISPAVGRESNFRCRYDPTAAAAHIGREALPDYLKAPWLQIFPEPRPTVGVPERGEAPPEIIRIELFRF